MNEAKTYLERNTFSGYIEDVKIKCDYDALSFEILEILRHIIYTDEKYDRTIKIDYCKPMNNNDDEFIECQISCGNESLKAYFMFIFDNYGNNFELHCIFRGKTKNNNIFAHNYTATNWDDLKTYVNEYVECFYNGFIE